MAGWTPRRRGSSSIPRTSNKVTSVKSTGGFYSDITGRGGLLLGNALIYGKGGVAFFTGNVRVIDAYDDISQNSGTFTGWTVGGGVEYQVWSNLTVKVEYQYIDLDNGNFSCCLPSSYGHLEDNITANTVKIGINYSLHGMMYSLN